MSYYSGRLIIKNETDDILKIKEQGLIATFKFSVNFNKQKLYLNNTILNQILESNTVQRYILKECSDTLISNSEHINNAIKGILSVEHSPKVNIKIIGKYFYVKFYCGRNHTITECLNSLKRLLKNEKSKIEILRGN